MKKLLAILLSALLLMTLLAACGTTDEPAADSPAPVSEAPESEAPVESAEPVELTIWHDNDENLMQAMADAANALLEGTGVSVTFEKRTGLSDQLKLYGGDAANGPDMYLWAHDSLGTFVAMDILEPLTDLVDESVLADDLPLTVEAGQIGGTQYCCPCILRRCSSSTTRTSGRATFPPRRRSSMSTWWPTPTPPPAPMP